MPKTPTPEDLAAAAKELRTRAEALTRCANDAVWADSIDRLSRDAIALRRVADMLDRITASGGTFELHRAAFAAGVAMAMAAE